MAQFRDNSSKVLLGWFNHEEDVFEVSDVRIMHLAYELVKHVSLIVTEICQKFCRHAIAAEDS